jgi:hypothetical protein
MENNYYKYVLVVVANIAIRKTGPISVQ